MLHSFSFSNFNYKTFHFATLRISSVLLDGFGWVRGPCQGSMLDYRACLCADCLAMSSSRALSLSLSLTQSLSVSLSLINYFALSAAHFGIIIEEWLFTFGLISHCFLLCFMFVCSHSCLLLLLLISFWPEVFALEPLSFELKTFLAMFLLLFKYFGNGLPTIIRAMPQEILFNNHHNGFYD